MDGEKIFLTETFQAFTFGETAPTTKTGVPSRKGRLSRIADEDLGVQLKDFRGFGKFHFTSPTEHDPQVELFITCDGKNVDIYNVLDEWEPIRRIPISNEGSILTNPRRIIEGLGGKYFSWLDKNNITYICDLETGKIAYTMDSGATIYFSKDGSLMLCNEVDDTTIRWTESGTMLATTKVEDSSLSQVFSAFTESGNRILVPVVKPDDRFGRGRQGMILDTTTLRPVERVSYSTRFHEQQPQTAGSRGQYLYSSHGSKLDLIRFQDITVAPYPQQRYECDDRCKSKLTDLQESEIIKETSNQQATVSIPNSELTVTVGFREVSLSRYAIVVSISDNQGVSHEVLQIPPLCIGTSCARYRIHVDEANLQLIADCQLIIMVWKLPTTLYESATLLSALWVQQFTYKEKNSERELGETSWSSSASLRSCHYGRMHAWLRYKTTLHLGGDDPISTYAFEFFNALFILIHMFGTGKESLKQAILKYTGLYINRTVEHEEHSETILTTICHCVRQENYALIYTFLKALFDSPDVRWVPKPGLSHEMNPISLLLHSSKTLPRAINLAQIVINHCIRIAKTENDWDFALPVLDSLHRLLKLQELPPDLVLSTFRGLAFIPEEERSHIINHAIIPRPFRLRRLFGNHNAKPIYAYKDPVLQIDDSPEFKEHDPLNENFTKDLFVASFDMLWRAPPKKPDARSPVERIIDRGPPQTPFWLHTLFSLILAKCNVWPDHRVQFYDLPLEALDNPAITALIEYKWYGVIVICPWSPGTTVLVINTFLFFFVFSTYIGTPSVMYTGSFDFSGSASFMCW